MKISEIIKIKGLSDNSLKLIDSEAKLVKFRIGQPIIENIISKHVILLLDGEARLLATENNKQITIAKLSKGSFIGMGSLLSANPCETVTASTEITAVIIPSEIIINLYSTEPEFKFFCQSTFFPGEILRLTEHLIRNSPRTDIFLIDAFNMMYKNAKIDICKNDQKLLIDNSYYNYIGSSNFEKIEINSVIESSKIFKVRPPLEGRILQIPSNIIDQFNTNIEILNSSIETTKYKELDQKLIKDDFSMLKNSTNVGQYQPEQRTKIIRGSGEIRVTVASLQMLSEELKLPFRKDSVEKIVRDEIRKGKKPSLDLCAGLMSMLGVYSSKAKISSKYITRLPTPSLIRWKDGFAVVQETNGEQLKIASPEEGFITIQEKELSKVFSESIEVLFVERSNLSPTKKFNIQWFIPSLKKYKNVLIQVLFASFIVQLFGLANPLLIQVIIDKVISQRSLDTLQVLGIALVGVTILGGIISSLRTYLFTETTNRIDTRLGSEVIDHLLRLPLNYFDKRPVGELGSRVAELEKIREFLTGQALTTILDAAFSVIYILVMVIYSWLLTLIALGVLPIQIGLTLLGSPLLRRQIRETAKTNANTQSHLVEVLTGVQTVKAQNVESVSRWKWQELYGKYISRTFEKTITITALQQTSQVLQQLSQLMVLWIGASLVLKGELTLGQLIAFRIISGYVTQPLLRLSSIWQSIQELRVSFERLADIIDTPEESNEADKANIPIPKIKGEIVFKDVQFRFNKNSPKILNNINLKIDQGKFVGIAGQSGSGKSTLMKLVPRLYSLDSGKILIDNFDISKVELYSLRKQIGIVPQDPLLFAGTVSENISLTDPNISSDEIIQAAKIADAHDFIMNLPSGYSSKIGERGAGLSGGQRQRIAIARTLLSKPNLIIMDEATSALDYETEKRVCENLKNESKGITVFFITHRLSTIKNADIIVMMHEGNICELGSHEELLENKSRYYALFRQQEAQ